MRRFFAQDIAVGEMLLTGQEAAHMTRVLRMQAGDELILFDGSGCDFAAQIAQLREDGVLLRVQEGIPATSEPEVDITLCQAIIKHDHFEYAIQKCTELGVKRFIPFISERCIKRPKSPQRFLERANRTALEAAKQCGRSLVPQVEPIVELEELAEHIQGKYTLLAYEGEQTTSIKQALRQHQPCELYLIVGPEGGFAPGEAAALVEAGAVSVSLGRLILRAETAGVAAAAMILYECGGGL